MSNVLIPNPRPEALIAMGDGLLESGDVEGARGMYGAAAKRAHPGETRRRARLRLGLCVAPMAAMGHLAILKALEDQKFSPTFLGAGLATWWKTLPFDDDARFLALVEKHAELLPLANWHWNLSTALWAVRQARDVPGDFVELGVFKGHTTLFCAEYVDFKTWPRRWWLYDTFTGIPEDQQVPGWEERNRHVYENTFSVEEVRARFAHIPNIDIIQGRVPEVLTDHGSPDAIAFLHIDLNNPFAEIAALDTLFDRVSPGGVVLFDDYGWNSARAQFVAERAWFEARGLHVLPIPTGQGVFIKR